MNKFNYVAIVAIFIISIFTNFVNLNYRYSVGWDQVRDAKIVYEQIIQDKDIVLLGPRVVGPEGFFLGPLHYYLLIPFYYFGDGDLISAAYLAATIGILTTLVFMFIAYKLFSPKVALVIGLITALMPQLISWNVMYLPILTGLAFFLSKRILEKKYKSLIYAGPLLGLGTHIHFTAIFLFFFIIIALYLSHPTKKDFKKVTTYSFFALAIMGIFALPLLLFDLKHNFMNSKLFFNFFFNGNNGFRLNIFESFRVFLNAFDILNLFKDTKLSALFSFLIISLASFSAYKFETKKVFIFVLIWIFTPLLLFSFYNGNITEYYFLTTGSIAILYLGLLVSKIEKWFIPLFSFALILSFIQTNTIISFKDPYALIKQKELANYLITQKQDLKFNLSYELPYGKEDAFTYTLMLHGKSPTNTDDSHLYTVIMLPTTQNFSDLKEFGGFGLVRR